MFQYDHLNIIRYMQEVSNRKEAISHTGICPLKYSITVFIQTS